MTWSSIPQELRDAGGGGAPCGIDDQVMAHQVELPGSGHEKRGKPLRRERFDGGVAVDVERHAIEVGAKLVVAREQMEVLHAGEVDSGIVPRDGSGSNVVGGVLKAKDVEVFGVDETEPARGYEIAGAKISRHLVVPGGGVDGDLSEVGTPRGEDGSG